jgi:hypothetical protein
MAVNGDLFCQVTRRRHSHRDMSEKIKISFRYLNCIRMAQHLVTHAICISLDGAGYTRAAVLNLWSADSWGYATPTQGVRDCLGN